MNALTAVVAFSAAEPGTVNETAAALQRAAAIAPDLAERVRRHCQQSGHARHAALHAALAELRRSVAPRRDALAAELAAVYLDRAGPGHVELPVSWLVVTGRRSSTCPRQPGGHCTLRAGRPRCRGLGRGLRAGAALAAGRARARCVRPAFPAPPHPRSIARAATSRSWRRTLALRPTPLLQLSGCPWLTSCCCHGSAVCLPAVLRVLTRHVLAVCGHDRTLPHVRAVFVAVPRPCLT